MSCGEENYELVLLTFDFRLPNNAQKAFFLNILLPKVRDSQILFVLLVTNTNL